MFYPDYPLPEYTTGQSRTEQDRRERNRTEENRRERNTTQQDRREQDSTTEENGTGQKRMRRRGVRG